MIEINLIPGSYKTEGAGTISISGLKGVFESFSFDKYLGAAVAAVCIAVAAIALMVTTQSARVVELEDRRRNALADSSRYSTVLLERNNAISYRDSILKQVTLIKSIDRSRYTWAHILDEINIALPPYTWLSSIVQLTSADLIDSLDSAKNDGNKKIDPRVRAGNGKDVTFRIIGQTVDVQALTLFMKQLAASPFLQNVQLGRSDLVLSGGKPVTEFQLEITTMEAGEEFIETIPLSIAVMN